MRSDEKNIYSAFLFSDGRTHLVKGKETREGGLTRLFSDESLCDCEFERKKPGPVIVVHEGKLISDAAAESGFRDAVNWNQQVCPQCKAILVAQQSYESERP